MENPPLVFYHKMGELFYALVASQIPVKATEYEQLRKLISTTWESGNSQQTTTQKSALAQIEIAFEWFDYENLDFNECFDSFKAYFKEYPELYTEERKDLIWETSKIVANSFVQNDEVENKLLTKLKKLLDK